MTADEVLARLADTASSNVLDFIDIDSEGCKLDLKLIRRRGVGHLVRRVRIRKDGTTDLDLESRLHALIKLGEYYKLWKGGEDQPITLVSAAKALEERYARLRRERESGETAGGMQEPTGPVQ